MTTLQAGHELDALVAEKVMGWAPGERGTPAFSTSIAAAWEVVEKMRADKLSVTLTGYWEGSTGKWWVNVLDNVETVATVRTDTAPHAICLAALKAVEDGR